MISPASDNERLDREQAEIGVRRCGYLRDENGWPLDAEPIKNPWGHAYKKPRLLRITEEPMGLSRKDDA